MVIKNPKKITIIRTYRKAKEIQYTDENNLLAKVNSQIGVLKKYNCRRLIANYAKTIHTKTQKIIVFDDKELKFNIK